MKPSIIGFTALAILASVYVFENYRAEHTASIEVVDTLVTDSPFITMPELNETTPEEGAETPLAATPLADHIPQENGSLTACPTIDTLSDRYAPLSLPVKIAFGITAPIEGVEDTDGDCLLDTYEIQYCSLYCNPAQATHESGISEFDTDYDNDGLSTGKEQSLGTSPLDPDTDHDTLADGDELDHKTNPLVADSDSDGLNDGTEIKFELNPLFADATSRGVFPATWKLTDDLVISLYIASTALEVVNFQNSYGNYWSPHNHVFWRKYSLEAIDYSFYFPYPVMVEKVVIANPGGKTFHPVYFLAESSSEITDFSDIIMARSSTVDEVTPDGNVHHIGSLVRSLALTDDFAQFQTEESKIISDL
jgi:hypothetical protein